MTNTVFPTFQTQYILGFSSASRRGTLGFSKNPNTQIFPSKDVASERCFVGQSIQLFESDRRVETQGAVLREKEGEFYQELARLRDRDSFLVGEFSAFVDKIR
jgi:hypothetical protein